MSTTFGVYIPSIDEIKPVARRRGAGNGDEVYVYFTNEVAELLDDDTTLIAIDNDNQGIWNIGDLKTKIKETNYE